MILIVSIIIIVLGFSFIIWNFDIAVSITSVIIVVLAILLLTGFGVIYYVVSRDKGKDDIKNTKAYRAEIMAQKWVEHILQASVTYLEGSLRRWEDLDGIVYYAFVFRRDSVQSSGKKGTRCIAIINLSNMEPQEIVDHPSSEQCEDPFKDFSPKEKREFNPHMFGDEDRRKPKQEYSSFKDFMNEESY